MAYHDSAVTSFTGTASLVANMPVTTVGDALYAFITQDANGDTYTPPIGWAQVDQISVTLPDSQTFTLFEFTGGAPSSPPATYTWTSGTTGDAQVVIVSISGRSLTRTFLTPSSNQSTNTSPVSAGFAGGTAAAGDDLVVFMGIDKFTSTDTWSFGVPTGTPGTFSRRQNSDISGRLTGCALATLDSVSAGATGTITDVITQTSGTTGTGWAGWVLSLAVGGPTINTQPQPTAVYAGQTATFSISATASAGGGSLSYQWKFNGSNVGSNQNTYSRITALSDNGGLVSCVVTDSNGSTTSANALLNVWAVPASAAPSGGAFLGGGPSRGRRMLN